MSRFKSLKANPRRSLAALATVLVAVGVTGASGASFTANSANPANTFTAGTMTMSNTRDNVAILSASNMKPGDPATKGEVTIKNTGSLSGDFTLSKGALTNVGAPGLSNMLNIVVTDCGSDQDCSTAVGNSTEYTGTIATMGTGISLDNWDADEEHTYQFAVDLDEDADNSYQGDSTEVEFVWNAA